MLVHQDMIVDEVMRKWPWTIRIFIQFGMKCVGCPFGTFHSVDHACDEHGIEKVAFLAVLDETIQDKLFSRSSLQPAE